MPRAPPMPPPAPRAAPTPQPVPLTAPPPLPAPRVAPAPQPVPCVAPVSPSAPHAASISRFTQPPGVLATAFGPHVWSSVYHPVVLARDPRSTHPMVTRRVVGITKPMDHLQLFATTSAPPTLSPVLTSVRSMLTYPNWHRAMEEYKALLSNNMWDMAPQPPRANVITSKWIFKHKLKVAGSFDRNKVCWVL
jgi:hypothetical protein